MTKISDALTYGLTIRESQNDGSDFTSPIADYRRLFLGEDGSLHLKDSAGTVTDVTAAAGAPTTTPYVTTAIDAGLSNEIVIPGLAGSPDIRVGGASDDEFDATDVADPMTGWTSFGSPTHNVNSTVLSHYHLTAPGTDNNLHGIYKAEPAATWTATTRMSDTNCAANYQSAGLMYSETATGKIVIFGKSSAKLNIEVWTNRTTYASNPYSVTFPINGLPIWLRIVVTSHTSVAYYYSIGGVVWRLIAAAHNPGFAIDNVGIYASSQNATGTVAAFDYIRFT